MGSTIGRIARLLGTTPTRRDVARALAGFAFGGTLVAADDTEAKHKHKHKHKHHKTCDPCQRKRHGKCRGKRPDGTSCHGDGQCFQGTCVPRPTCGGNLGICSDSVDCCSNACLDFPGAPFAFCAASQAGDACLESTDCAPTLSCIAYRCR
jgi:hypothetical protein